MENQNTGTGSQAKEKSEGIINKETVESMKRFVRQIKKARHELKYNRKNFWNKNKVNFRNNIKTLLSFFQFPEGWEVNVVASQFLVDREVLPYDLDVWSFSDVVSGTKAQGYNIIIFFNRTDLEFLSAPALLPIVVHEVAHVYQVPKDPKTYLLQTVDDSLSRKYEEEADAEVKKYSDEFRKENVLEKVMYCYDKRNWEGAKKMVNYLHLEAKNSFGGGYDEAMAEEEYKAFLKAEEEKDIDLFIDYFIENFREEESKGIISKIREIFKKSHQEKKE